ncbi:MAG: thioesterase family protein [Burkholderiaceae bacterium]|jgi:acyl-coenzyme A thioesterase PaaI-like protein|nr:thioesterase family protein [Burkholderiaceae bacterium]
MTLPTPPHQHPFDQALALASHAAGVLHGRPHPAWANMVGPYGGITAAQMLQAVWLHPDRLGEPVALTVNFAAGLRDAPFVVEARPARTNRSTQHWTMALTQSGEDGASETMITATALTAARRVTWSATDAPMPAVPRPSDTERRPLPSRQVPWLERYDMRFIAGHIPQTWDGAEADSVTCLWMRDDPPRPLDFASLSALADVFFPRVWRRRAVMTPIGTVSMTVYFHAGAAELAACGDDFVLGLARAQSFFNGYFDQSAELWSEAGQLLATTHQIVYYKE